MIKNKYTKYNERIKDKMSSCLRTFYDKSMKKLTDKRSMIEDLVSTRENFKTKFNFHKQAEMNLLNILKLENELTDLNQCLEYYESLKNSEFKSDLVNKVHQIISMKKEEIILNDINRLNRKDISIFKKHLEDYKINNWKFSNETLTKLKELTN